MFDFLNVLFGYILQFCCKISLNNYIFALFYFALLMQIILFPLGIKQQKSSVTMAKVRPKEMAIRRKYKNRTDKASQQKMTMEIQDMYKAEGHSMFAGCLPLLIQLPIIFALFAVVRMPLTYTTPLDKTDDSGITLEQFYDKGVEIAETQISLIEKARTERGDQTLFAEEYEEAKKVLDGLKAEMKSGTTELTLADFIYDGTDKFIKFAEKEGILEMTLSQRLPVSAVPFASIEAKKEADNKYIIPLREAQSYTSALELYSYDATVKLTEIKTLNFDDLLAKKGVEVSDLPNYKFVGNYTALETPTMKLNILLLIPILIFVSSYFSGVITRKFSAQQLDANGNDMSNSAFMKWGLPLMSTFFSFQFPVAIGVYWIYRSVFTVLQQLILAKMYPIPRYTQEELALAEAEVTRAKKRKKILLIAVDEDDDSYDHLVVSEEKAEKIRKRQLKAAQEEDEKIKRRFERMNAEKEAEDGDSDSKPEE